LGLSETAATLPISTEPNQNVRLTLRYTRIEPQKTAAGQSGGIVLSGVNFDTGKSTIRKDSYEQLDTVVEYMAHKPGVRVEISGHTDNVGDKGANKKLSLQRAQACVDYLVKKGIERSRLEAVGYGDQIPVASNVTPDGREQNRRIEAREL
jgi:outer membrane protein OmpA-like peptidoglycan-associated protein